MRSSYVITLWLEKPLRTQNEVKIDLNDFLGKALFSGFWVKRGQNRPKSFFKFYQKLTVSISLHKIAVSYKLKIHLTELSGEKSCVEVFG